MSDFLRPFRSAGACVLAAVFMMMAVAGAARANEQFTAQEIVDSGHRFFGATSGGLATVVEKIFSS